MAFGARYSEVKYQLDKLVGLQGDEADRIKAALRNYSSAREDALSAIVAVLADSGDDPKRSDYEDKLSSGRARVMQPLNTMLDGLSALPSFPATLFRTQLQMQESAFFASLQKMDLGAARDTLLGFKKRLSGMMDVLDAKWQATTDQDKRIQDAEKQAAKDMAEAMKGAIAAGVGAFGQLSKRSYLAADWVKSLGDNINEIAVGGVKAIVKAAQDSTYGKDLDRPEMDPYADMIPKMSDPGKELFERAKAMGIEAKDLAKMATYLVQNPGMDYGDRIEDLIKAVCDHYLGGDDTNYIVLMIKMLGECKKGIGVLLEPYLRARQALVSQLPYEGTILLCFSQARADVDKFIDENGIDRAGQYIDTVEDDVKAWQSANATPGLNADAATFSGLVITAFDARLSELRGIFSGFVSRNQGRFIGEISDSTQKTLIDLENWNSTRDELIGLSLDQRLKEWRANCLTIGPGCDDAFSQILQQVATLPGAFQSRVRDRLNSIYINLKSQVAQAQQDTSVAIDGPERNCNADEIKKVFDRGALMADLR